MFTLHIEHVVSDYDAWKKQFDSDPLDRKASGVRAFRVTRPVDDPRYAIIDLDFDTRDAGARMQEALAELWQNAGRSVMINPSARLTEVVESGTP